MGDKNFPAQHVGQGAEGADRNLLTLQISPSLNLRSDDKSMQEKLFTDIDYFSLDVARHHSVESARRVSKLKRIGKKSHTAQVASRSTDFHVQLFLSVVTILLGDDKWHNPHRIIRHANFELPCLRLGNIGTQEQKHHRQCQCQNIEPRHVYILSIKINPSEKESPKQRRFLSPLSLGLPFGSLYFRFCLFGQAQIKNFAKLDLPLDLQHFARAFHDFAHGCVFQSAAGIMPEHIIVVNLLRYDRVLDALHFLSESDGLRGILPIIARSFNDGPQKATQHRAIPRHELVTGHNRRRKPRRLVVRQLTKALLDGLQALG